MISNWPTLFPVWISYSPLLLLLSFFLPFFYLLSGVLFKHPPPIFKTTLDYTLFSSYALFFSLNYECDQKTLPYNSTHIMSRSSEQAELISLSLSLFPSERKKWREMRRAPFIWRRPISFFLPQSPRPPLFFSSPPFWHITTHFSPRKTIKMKTQRFNFYFLSIILYMPKIKTTTHNY